MPINLVILNMPCGNIKTKDLSKRERVVFERTKQESRPNKLKQRERIVLENFLFENVEKLPFMKKLKSKLKCFNCFLPQVDSQKMISYQLPKLMGLMCRTFSARNLANQHKAVVNLPSLELYYDVSFLYTRYHGHLSTVVI